MRIEAYSGVSGRGALIFFGETRGWDSADLYPDSALGVLTSRHSRGIRMISLRDARLPAVKHSRGNAYREDRPIQELMPCHLAKWGASALLEKVGAWVFRRLGKTPRAETFDCSYAEWANQIQYGFFRFA
jgi:hypothetical protein